MVQNSKVQKCTMIDVSLSLLPLPPAENYIFPYVHRTLLGRIHTKQHSGLSLWSEMFAMIIYSCLLCANKRQVGAKDW